jgi:hypothetical protein
VPLYIQRIDANLFVDHGGAFNKLDLDGIELFEDGALIDSPQLHTGVGGELWTSVTIGYGLGALIRLGYAFGFSHRAEPGGQGYFIAASAF